MSQTDNIGNLSSDLQAAIAAGIIDMGIVREKLIMRKREKILNEHRYALTEGRDGWWNTYLPDNTKPNHRRRIKRKTLAALQDAVYEHYAAEAEQVKQKSISLETLFPKWLEYYSLRSAAETTVKRAAAEWNRHYRGSSFASKPIAVLTGIDVETWVLEQLRTAQMTKKQYYNFTQPLRQMLEYAKDAGIIDGNPMENVHVNPRAFRKEKKRDNKTQVFTPEEEAGIIAAAWKDWQKDRSGAPLAVILMFYTGVRVGEAVAFKKEDVSTRGIRVCRMETKTFTSVKSGIYHQSGYKVVDHVKTEAGFRTVYLPAEARKVIAAAIESDPKSEWLFTTASKRATMPAIAYRMKKYCRQLGIPNRSPHKIRKTYISKLIDAGVNINKIRELVGHEDERTTFHSYCFDRSDPETVNKQLEETLNLNGLPIGKHRAVNMQASSIVHR